MEDKTVGDFSFAASSDSLGGTGFKLTSVK